jgi:hypothetical protein
LPSRAGQPTTLQLRPYRKVPGGWLPVLLPAETRWRVTLADAGAKRKIPVRVLRDAENPYLWSGSVRFPTRGRWILRVGSAPRDSLRVDVARRTLTPGVWATLQRPLRIPTIGPGTPCPTTDANGDLSRFGGPTRPAWGTGPAYPTLDSGTTGGPLLRYPYPPPSGFYGSQWSGEKVVWYIDREVYSGPLLIRGRQVDGMDTLRFDQGPLPSREIRVPPGPRDRGGYIRVRRPGCFAYQVDGTSFSSLIVFEAIPVPS